MHFEPLLLGLPKLPVFSSWRKLIFDIFLYIETLLPGRRQTSAC